jgi:hypothetical protein
MSAGRARRAGEGGGQVVDGPTDGPVAEVSTFGTELFPVFGLPGAL